MRRSLRRSVLGTGLTAMLTLSACTSSADEPVRGGPIATLGEPTEITTGLSFP
ncbi:hypothetical protein [Catenuloplanes atrovinosus]|uniref:Uncharacterized protein n=1 Tax=Catenuloplanes atrovinosus TaxID=137266 RepID=A0AAE4CD54_9ACTN|nr:hypothetical protein [Catenuloplanes atrovinosus]MDR7277185.1 hypothetical protein [Catenuloplanes atrovinosus]